MKPDYYSLVKAGLSQEDIAKISGCEDPETQTGCCENAGVNC